MRSDILFPKSPFNRDLPARATASPGTSGAKSLFDLAPKTSFGNAVNLAGTGISPDKDGRKVGGGTSETVTFGESREAAPKAPVGAGALDAAKAATFGEQSITASSIPKAVDESLSPNGDRRLTIVGSNLTPSRTNTGFKPAGVDGAGSNQATNVGNSVKPSVNLVKSSNVNRDGFAGSFNAGKDPYDVTSTGSAARPTPFLEGASFLSGVTATSARPPRPLATSAPSSLTTGLGSGGKTPASPGEDRSISELFFANQQGNPAAALLPTGGFKKEFDSSLLSDTGDSYANSLIGGGSTGTLGSGDSYTDSDYYYSDTDTNGENRYDRSDKSRDDSKYDYKDYNSDDNSEDQYGEPYDDYNDDYPIGNDGSNYSELGKSADYDSYGPSGSPIINNQSPPDKKDTRNSIDNTGNYIGNGNNYKFTEFDTESNSDYTIDKSKNDEYGDGATSSDTGYTSYEGSQNSGNRPTGNQDLSGSSSSQQLSPSKPYSSLPDNLDDSVYSESEQPSGYIENYNPSINTNGVSSSDLGRSGDAGYSNEKRGGLENNKYAGGNYNDASYNTGNGQGFGDSGYVEDDGYSDSRHTDDENSDTGYNGGGFRDNGYNDGGYTDSGYKDGGYSDNKYRDSSYSGSGYGDSGSIDNDYNGSEYNDNGYTDSGYSDNGYNDIGDSDNGYTDSGYSDNGYNDIGDSDNGYTDGGYIDSGYSDGGDPQGSYGGDGEYNSNKGINSIDSSRPYDEGDSSPTFPGSNDLSSGRYIDSQSSGTNGRGYDNKDSSSSSDSDTGYDNSYDASHARGYNYDPSSRNVYKPGSLDRRGFRPGISDPGPAPKNAYADDYSNLGPYDPDTYREPEIATSKVDTADNRREPSEGDEAKKDGELLGGSLADNNIAGSDTGGSQFDSSYPDFDTPPPLDYAGRGAEDGPSTGSNAGEVGSYNSPGRDSGWSPSPGASNLAPGFQDESSETGSEAFGTSYIENNGGTSPLLDTNKAVSNDISHGDVGRGSTHSENDDSFAGRFPSSALPNRPSSQHNSAGTDSIGSSGNVVGSVGKTSPTFSVSPTSLVIVPDDNPLIVLPVSGEEAKPFVSSGPKPFNRPS